jgi:hypothetical protein
MTLAAALAVAAGNGLPTGALAYDAGDDRWGEGWSGDDGDQLGPEPPVADTPMYLSHHWPEQYDRCSIVGGLHVCRRCLVLYPLAIVTAVAVSIGSWWPHRLDAWALWVLPLAGVIEFVADNIGTVAYSARRQAILSSLGAVAAGIGYTRYLHDTTDPLVWSVVAVYTSVCVAGVVIGTVRRRTAR